MRRLALAVLPVALAALLAACGSTNTAGSGGVQVVAAENFWGSIATQLAGTKASVRSIIVNPAQDPHSYEPNALDARTMATAGLAIVNGIGYDNWSSKLLAANPAPGRTVINVGNLLGLHEGDNPHRWYSPSDVAQVADAITAALKRRDPHDAGYFDSLRRNFDQRSLAQYHALIAQIKKQYSGTPVGASESIFAPLAGALGLRLLTPATFTKAISEGTDLSAQDKLVTERQVSSRQIKVWIYNSQNATPEIQHLNQLAHMAGIPVVTVTETLAPPNATFEQWQVEQLRRLELALQRTRAR